MIKDSNLNLISDTQTVEKQFNFVFSEDSMPENLVLYCQELFNHTRWSVEKKSALFMVISDKISNEECLSDEKKALMLQAASATIQYSLATEEKSQFIAFIRSVKSIYKIVTAIFHVGEHSEADTNKEHRENKKINTLNQWIEYYDSKIYHETKTCLDFIEKISPKEPISQVELEQLAQKLSENAPSTLEKMYYGARRQATSIIGGLLEENLNSNLTLTKAQRNQIHMIQELLHQLPQEQLTSEKLKIAHDRILRETVKQKIRDENNVSAITKRYLHGKIDFATASTQIIEATAHPFNKTLQNPDLNRLQKAAKLTQTAAKPITYLLSYAANSAQDTLRNAITQPPALIIKSSLTAFNLLEFAQRYIYAKLTSNQEERVRMEEEAQGKLSNAKYNSIQSLCSFIATAMTTLLVATTATSAGVAMPLAFSLKSIAVQVTMEVIHNGLDALDGIELLDQIAKEIEAAPLEQRTYTSAKRRCGMVNPNIEFESIYNNSDTFTYEYHSDLENSRTASLDETESTTSFASVPLSESEVIHCKTSFNDYKKAYQSWKDTMNATDEVNEQLENLSNNGKSNSL